MFKLKNQMLRLLSVSALGSFSLGGASWVVLLSARGFSMPQIGFAEAIFHVASLLFEVPSGALADVCGRKRALIYSQWMSILSSVLMILSRDMTGVCLSLVFSAVSYNFASGTREALAYDSLKSLGNEGAYLRYSSIEMMVYRLGSASAVLCAGFALTVGYKAANFFDMAMACICLLILAGVREAMPQMRKRHEPLLPAISACFAESFIFLRKEKHVRRVMFSNALLGALAILLSFFLQARLQKSDLAYVAIGPALFIMGLGGALGSRLALRFARIRMRTLMPIGAAVIALGIVLGAQDSVLCMILGGFVAGMCDDILQVNMDSRLNDLFPSEQRATILSVSSLLFSMTMIVLSPLAGWFFGCL